MTRYWVRAWNVLPYCNSVDTYPHRILSSTISLIMIFMTQMHHHEAISRGYKTLPVYTTCQHPNIDYCTLVPWGSAHTVRTRLVTSPSFSGPKSKHLSLACRVHAMESVQE